MKNKSLAAGLAFFLGGLGIHKFYLNRGGQGILYALFFWTFIPAILGFIEAIGYISMSQEQFDAKYNQDQVKTAPSKPSTLTEQADGTAVAICPACAEEIKPEALKCKHCGTDIAPRASTNSSTPTAAQKSLILKVILAIFLLFMLYGVVMGVISALNAG